MKSWYLTKSGTGQINHGGQNVPEGKKIYLSDAQARLHGESIIETSDPSVSEAFVNFDWELWQEFIEEKQREQGTTAQKQDNKAVVNPQSKEVTERSRSEVKK